jgi:hypothetical protein
LLHLLLFILNNLNLAPNQLECITQASQAAALREEVTAVLRSSKKKRGDEVVLAGTFTRPPFSST